MFVLQKSKHWHGTWAKSLSKIDFYTFLYTSSNEILQPKAMVSLVIMVNLFTTKGFQCMFNALQNEDTAKE